MARTNDSRRARGGQALTPYPQYCSPLRGANENLGSSTYHSFQLKAENRFSHGLWFLGAYTASKLLTNADSVQTDATRPAPAMRQPAVRVATAMLRKRRGLESNPSSSAAPAVS